ncbi:MAG: RHS repeat-associated core domain-containing protein [Prevotella sp.]|jgi:RHS repeat-associated protein|nr:RHS repeat-associated core domain-containing protein [Prevotella sp.]
MKRIIYILTILLFIHPVLGYQSIFSQVVPTFTKSRIYINTRVYTNEAGTTYLDNVQYYNSFGLPEQTIQVGASPAGADMITLQEYDEFGRESQTWLPAIKSANKGAYMPETTVIPLARTSNGNDQSPFSKMVYENSALNRVLAQYGPGQDWHKTYGNDSKAVRMEYMTNTASGVLLCAQYTCTTGDNLTFKKTGNYAAGELYITKITDEDGNISYEFKNEEDQVVLTRQINGAEQLDTYYVYDNLGNPRFVLPPLASDALTATNTNWTEATAAVKNYAYLYKYDGRQRCIYKKLPGCDPVYYIYDKAGNLILTQDGEQRAKSEWAFSISDALGRIAIAGTCKNAVTNTTASPYYKYLWNVAVKATRTNATNTTKGYTVSGLTLTTPIVLAANYYDNYHFMGKNSIPDSTNVNVKYEAVTGYGTRYNNATGQLTGTLTAQMNPDGTISSAYLYSVMYYDNRGRMVQTKSNNHLAGGLESEYIAYSFTGQPTQTRHVHSATGKTTQTEVYTNTYDHAGRLRTTSHNLNNATTNTTLANNTYDELGRLKTNQKHTHANLKTTYVYNIRSWTKSISSPLFKQTLFYNDRVTAHTYSDYKPLYNGNISGMEWQVGTETKRSYRFTYDALSRINHAGYNGLSSGGMYNVKYTYDKHGNIETINRRGKNSLAADNNKRIDMLTMTYTGNQLIKAEDEETTISLAESGDFKNYSNVATEYTYNKNGAMAKDLNKGITAIQYNSLNLPRMMDIKSPVAEARNEYLYSAGGVKLKVTQKWNPNFSTAPVIGSAITVSALTQTKTTDYVGNKVYEDGVLKRILVDGGYIESGVYYFNLNDHLGNNRVVANASGTAIQKNHYYPFGMAFAETPLAEQQKQPYKYNGKELDQMHGLNLYDYSARQYDPAIGRFPTVDPLAEKYYNISPYVYVANNPLKFIDPDGRDLVITGSLSEDALKQLQDRVGDVITLKMEEGKVSYSQNSDGKLKGDAKRLSEVINDNSITVNLRTIAGDKDANGNFFMGGAFQGNEVSIDKNGLVTVQAYQDVNPAVLERADEHTKSPGKMMMHEVTEAYEGGKISKENRTSSPNAKTPGTVFDKAHGKATKQSRVEQRMYDYKGIEVFNSNQASKVTYSVTKNGKSKVFFTKQGTF